MRLFVTLITENHMSKIFNFQILHNFWRVKMLHYIRMWYLVSEFWAISHRWKQYETQGFELCLFQFKNPTSATHSLWSCHIYATVSVIAGEVWSYSPYYTMEIVYSKHLKIPQNLTVPLHWGLVQDMVIRLFNQIGQVLRIGPLWSRKCDLWPFKNIFHHNSITVRPK